MKILGLLLFKAKLWFNYTFSLIFPLNIILWTGILFFLIFDKYSNCKVLLYWFNDKLIEFIMFYDCFNYYNFQQNKIENY